jgi:hypothetical protein
MPKEPTTPTKSAARTAAETPRKRWTPKKPSPESLDESKWRESKIKPDKRVRIGIPLERGAEAEIGLQLKKTDALEKYHLQPKDLEGLYYIPDL